MAAGANSGTVVQKIGSPENRRHWLMTDDVAAVDDGVWVDVGKFAKQMELEIKGITTATVQLRGDSGTSKPLDSVHGDQLGVSVTSNGRLEVTFPPRWIKTRISVWTAGTIKITMTGSA